MLPPCKDVLMQKLARCNYVAYLWKHAHLGDPLVSMEPTNHGAGKRRMDYFLPHWFRGSQMPSMLSETMEPTDFSDREDDDDDEDNDIIDDEDYSEDEDDSDVD